MDKIDKSFITGFEKDHIWINISKKRTYQFFNDGTGVVLEKNDISTDIKWELINKGSNSVLKIGCKGIIYYYIFKEKNNKDEYSVILKTKEKEDKVIFLLEALTDKPIPKERNKNSEISLSDKYKLSDLNTTDKVFLGFIYVVIALFIIILLQLTEILSAIPILATIILSLLATTFIVLYLKDPFIYISKKYKKEIEDIIFKK